MEKFLNILFKVWWIGGLIFLTVMLLKNKPVEENAFSHCWNCGTGIYLSDEEVYLLPICPTGLDFVES